MTTKGQFKQLGVNYRVTQVTGGIVQYRVTKKDSTCVLVIRVEPDFDNKVVVSYTDESLRRKPLFVAQAICDPDDVFIHIEALVNKHFA